MSKEPKLKDCANENCDKQFRQFNSLVKVCSTSCDIEYSKENPKKGLNKKSVKRTIQEEIYKDLRTTYLNKNPLCECDKTRKATQIHHMNGREGDRLNDVVYFLAVCDGCHKWIHANPKESREKGWLK